MKSTWKGHLGFGLTQIPVSLMKATEDNSVGFHQHHGPDCLGRIGMLRMCKKCGKPVEYADIVSGTEVDGKVVIVTADEKAQMQGVIPKQIEILHFCQRSEINSLQFGGGYYIGSADGQKAYSLLAQAMTNAGVVAVGAFALRTKMQRCAIEVDSSDPESGRLILTTLLWPDEVRKPEGIVGPGAAFSDREMRAAQAAIDSMIEPYNPDEHSNDYAARVRELIAAKAPTAPAADDEAAVNLDAAPPDVTDLVALLEKTAAQRSRQNHPAGKKRAPARKARRSA